MRRASVRPMIQVSCVAGHACCNVRMTGTTWHVSPIAESLRMQRLCGGRARGSMTRSSSAKAVGGERMSGRWSLGSEVKRRALEGGAMLYDASRVSNLSAEWFDPQHWAARGEVEGLARGRGSVHYISSEGRRFVLRHYRRGGWAARWSADRYLWQGEDESRPFTGVAAYLPAASRGTAGACAARRPLSCMKV